MTLPQVTVTATAGEPPAVTVDGVLLPGVRSAQVTVSADGVPQVALVLTAASVDLELPAAVSVLRAGSSATVFAQQLTPGRLELAALEHLDDDVTQGEAFVAAVTVAARAFDDGA